jgi:hypothetical protein
MTGILIFKPLQVLFQTLCGIKLNYEKTNNIDFYKFDSFIIL